MSDRKTLSVHFDAQGYQVGELVHIDLGDGPTSHVITKVDKEILPPGGCIRTRVEFVELSEYDGKTREGLKGVVDND